ncbi:MAG TPA: VWA domain-containing protein [Vicinamibacterales bacterium]
MRRITIIAVVLVSLVSARPIARQGQSPPAQRAQGTVEAQTTAIMVDVVVRDRRGNPVTDLKPGDFELLEDGVPQEIGSVVFYGTPGATGGDSTPAEPAQASAGASAMPAAERGALPAPPPVIALVFDRLTPEARALAYKAALDYVRREGNDALVGVFGIDLSLITYQTYTSDPQLLAKALDTLAMRSTSQFASNAAEMRDAAGRASSFARAAQNLQAGATGPGGGQAGSASGAAAAEAQLAEMERRRLETFEVLERDQQGYATTHGLLALVNSMRALPGRKSMIFFSEGLAIPPAVASQFRTLIDTANRANVSIYAMDAAGLRTESTQRETADQINAAAQRNFLQRNPSADVVGGAMTADLEINEDRLRADPHAGLGQLTAETGGILVRNTNDLGGGFRRVDEDMRNYYMLTYVPKNDRFDGQFRNIEVRVKRGGMEVAARKGYFAVRDTGTQPVMAFEAPALAMLDVTPVPNAFPVRAAAVRFPETDRPGLVPVLVAVPASNLTYEPVDDGKAYRADFTVLVRFRDGKDQIVRKLSQHYALNTPADKLEEIKAGQVLFFRQPELDPGVYGMETVVYDAIGTRASVRFSTVEVPEVDPAALRVSNLILVSRGERLPEGERPRDNPFLVDDILLYPNLGEPLKKGRDSELAFFFTVYPPKGDGAPPAVLELMKDGRLLARSPLELPAPDANGRIQHVSRLPLDPLEPGTYDLRVVVGDGKSRQLRSVLVRIAG